MDAAMNPLPSRRARRARRRFPLGAPTAPKSELIDKPAAGPVRRPIEALAGAPRAPRTEVPSAA
jgi:hypothetical protein